MGHWTGFDSLPEHFSKQNKENVMRFLVSLLLNLAMGHDARHDPRLAAANSRPERLFR